MCISHFIHTAQYKVISVCPQNLVRKNNLGGIKVRTEGEMSTCIHICRSVIISTLPFPEYTAITLNTIIMWWNTSKRKKTWANQQQILWHSKFHTIKTSSTLHRDWERYKRSIRRKIELCIPSSLTEQPDSSPLVLQYNPPSSSK